MSKKIYILLLEDDPVCARVTVKFFERKAENKVFVAKTAEEGVEICQKNPFDLVIMNIDLPDLDAVEAAKQIKAIAGRHGTPVVALLTDTDSDTDEKNDEKKNRERYTCVGIDNVYDKLSFMKKFKKMTDSMK